MADQHQPGSAIPNRPSLCLPKSNAGNLAYSTASVVSVTPTITTTTAATTQFVVPQPPARHLGCPRQPTLPMVNMSMSVLGLGSARKQKGALQLDLANSIKAAQRTPILEVQPPPKPIPKQRPKSGNKGDHVSQRPHSLSPSRKSSNHRGKVETNKLTPLPLGISNGKLLNHSPDSGFTVLDTNRTKREFSVKPLFTVENDRPVNLPPVPPERTERIVKKKVVYHLPPPGPHAPSSSIGMNHRDRTYKRDKISRGINSIQTSGKLMITKELQVEFTADDLKDLGEIGRGGFGTVNKMVHRKSNTIIAVKRIRATVDEKEQNQLMDLDVVMRSNECACIVQFYGAIFKEGDCWICMELMDTSSDKFYKYIYEILEENLPENMLGKITVATLIALNYLKEKLKIIHRDVKPSNILLDRRGNIKLCDFGISGQLVDSIAKTRDAGCRPYMAPERIDPARARGYDVRSDVWSLGITLMELATGCFPYPKWNSVFEQLTQVVQGDPPRLTLNENGNIFTEEFVEFVNTCLIKDECSRPKYKQLLEHPFVLRSSKDSMDVAGYICGIMDQMANNGRLMYTHDSYN